MGFECNFSYIPRLKNTDDAHCYILEKYARFKEWVENDPWCIRMVSNGHEFEFRDYDLRLTEKDLPENMSEINLEDMKKFVSSVERENFDNCIGYWCSSGRYFDEKIKKIGKKIFDGCYVIGEKESQEIKKIAKDWLKDHELVEVGIKYAYKYNDDDTITLIPADGIELEFDDGSTKRVSSESGSLFASKKFFNEDEKLAYERLLECMEKIDSVIQEGFLVYYETE